MEGSQRMKEIVADNGDVRSYVTHRLYCLQPLHCTGSKNQVERQRQIRRVEQSWA